MQLPLGYSGGLAAELPTTRFIEERVRLFQSDHSTVHTRMDSDLERYELKKFNANVDGTQTFPSYTSNAPRTYAKKIVSLLSSAEMFFKVPYGVAQQEQRTQHDVKERFCYGLIEAADNRLMRRLQVRIKPQLIWYAALRGFICLRRVLVRAENGETYVDILPLDPRTAAWGVGYNGLEWAAYTVMRKGHQLRSQYGVSLGGPESAAYEVTDYYDEQFNAVVVKGHGFIKEPTPHGAIGVPIDIVPVGTAPEIHSPHEHMASSGYGESIYAENRDIYEKRNHILSVYLALVSKARDRSYVLTSTDGTGKLKDNPNEAAGVLSLPSTSTLELVELSETTKDAAILAQVVGEEMHFGSLSKTSYGDVPFQLSGFAINSLRQSVFSILQPIVAAVQDAYTLALNGLCEQYMTGRYDSMTLSGYTQNRAYFSEQITPKAIKGLPAITVTMTPDLPQDDVGNMSTAVQARTPDKYGVPILPDIDILERIVRVQDVGATTDAIKEQQAERASPRALAYTLMAASDNRGREDLASIWFGELMITQLNQMVELAMARMRAAQVGVQAGTDEGQPKPPGISTSVMPGAALGKPQPTPTPQGGANVPTGTPRPGAREIPPVVAAWGR